MAIPFSQPDESDSTSHGTSQQQSVAPPPAAMAQSNSVQFSQMDSEALTQAFYEALIRCSQGKFPTSLLSSSPASPSRREHFSFPTPSSSSASSPRSSFRSSSYTHRHGDSFGNLSHFSDDDDDLYEFDWNGEQNFLNENQPKKPKNNKITKFVISALQFVIDSLKK